MKITLAKVSTNEWEVRIRGQRGRIGFVKRVPVESWLKRGAVTYEVYSKGGSFLQAFASLRDFRDAVRGGYLKVSPEGVMR